MIELLNAIDSKRKVICITGRIAEGKSVAMSVLANEVHKEFGACAFTNYGLANAQPFESRKFAKDFMQPEEYEVISIDEGASVFHYSPWFPDHFLSDDQKDSSMILFFTSFSFNRIDEDYRKKVDIHLSVKKVDDEIIVSGVNVPYERTIKIADSIGYYNAFQEVQYKI